jgi:hypothetical protein
MTMRTHWPRHVYRNSHVLEVTPEATRTRNWRPWAAGSVWSPGASPSTLVGTSLELPRRIRVLGFVAKLWPSYQKSPEGG